MVFGLRRKPGLELGEVWHSPTMGEVCSDHDLRWIVLTPKHLASYSSTSDQMLGVMKVELDYLEGPLASRIFAWHREGVCPYV